MKTKLYALIEAAEFYWSKLIGIIPSQCIRKYLFRIAGGKIDKTSVIYGGSEMRCIRKIRIGKYSSIGHRAILDGRGGLTIGNSVNLSTGVWIWTAQHDINDAHFKSYSAPVNISDYAWLGSRVVVIPGINIGVGAVVASGAVVTKNVADYTIVGGVPAKEIGVRNTKIDYQLGSCIPFI